MKLPLLVVLGLVAGLLAGCSTINSRIKEKAPVFAALDAATQAKLQRGVIELGYTPDMVYIALGAPDEKHERQTPKGKTEVWSYLTTYHEFAGTGLVGYEPVVVHNPRTGARYVYLDPVYSDMYREFTQEDMRIVFHDGHVVAIEQAKS
ncbi:MAG TPA: hypothetical protein PLU52_07635 [Opitutaceae bacterium]|nr:hypothetical protein [Opitutaceae bacterium]HND60378.1 hypothetical protein [Opitutaceae bacterium]